MQAIVSGETPFKVLKDSVAIGATGGYTLQYSTSKEGPWTSYDEATPANECAVVNGLVPYMWLRLSGCTDTEVEVIL